MPYYFTGMILTEPTGYEGYWYLGSDGYKGGLREYYMCNDFFQVVEYKKNVLDNYFERRYEDKTTKTVGDLWGDEGKYEDDFDHTGDGDGTFVYQEAKGLEYFSSYRINERNLHPFVYNIKEKEVFMMVNSDSTISSCNDTSTLRICKQRQGVMFIAKELVRADYNTNKYSFRYIPYLFTDDRIDCEMSVLVEIPSFGYLDTVKLNSSDYKGYRKGSHGYVIGCNIDEESREISFIVKFNAWDTPAEIDIKDLLLVVVDK